MRRVESEGKMMRSALPKQGGVSQSYVLLFDKLL